MAISRKERHEVITTPALDLQRKHFTVSLFNNVIVSIESSLRNIGVWLHCRRPEVRCKRTTLASSKATIG